MKRFAISALLLAAAIGMAHAQEEVGAHNPFGIWAVDGMQELVEVSVDRFELGGSWYSTISGDRGFTVSRLFRGGPLGREPIPGEEGMDIPDEHVLGVRVDFLGRGLHDFTVRAVRPIPIEGITKTVSVWVAGRNANHELRLLIRDMRGRQHSIHMGNLNFQGWRQLTAAIPPQPFNGVNGVVQRSHRQLSHRTGIEIVGFQVFTDLAESYGSYYIYFDDLRAVTDIFASAREPDDMVDGW